MKVTGLLKHAERYVIDNAPTLLTAFAVTGTLTTAYLTGKGTFKAAKIIQSEKDRRLLSEMEEDNEVTTKEAAKMVWTCYIPAGVSVATTICCMVAANSISSSRLAAIAAAYAMSDRNFTEYKDKVKEMFGEKKSNEVRAAVAQDHVDRNPPGNNVVQGVGGNTLCLDKWTGRYFRSDMQSIRAIENDFAKSLNRGNNFGVATLDDFYQALGLAIPKCAENFGWNQDAPIDLTFDSVLHQGEPVLVMDFACAPFPVGSYFGNP
jgi:hypothetical protein